MCSDSGSTSCDVHLAFERLWKGWLARCLCEVIIGWFQMTGPRANLRVAASSAGGQDTVCVSVRVCMCVSVCVVTLKHRKPPHQPQQLLHPTITLTSTVIVLSVHACNGKSRFPHTHIHTLSNSHKSLSCALSTTYTTHYISLTYIASLT